MQKLLKLVLLVTVMGTWLSGCLSNPPPQPNCWTIEMPNASVAGKTLFMVNVRAPYDGRELVVLRGDGSVARDAYNVFAAAPHTLIKAAASDWLVAHNQTAESLTVTRLALDCRGAERVARVELTLVQQGRARMGVATAPVVEGNYTQAFSQALAAALERATESTK